MRKKMKEECSKVLWNKITNCWNLQEPVSFQYRHRMPTLSPMCHESGTEPWLSRKGLLHTLGWAPKTILSKHDLCFRGHCSDGVNDANWQGGEPELSECRKYHGSLGETQPLLHGLFQHNRRSTRWFSNWHMLFGRCQLVYGSMPEKKWTAKTYLGCLWEFVVAACHEIHPLAHGIFWGWGSMKAPGRLVSQNGDCGGKAMLHEPSPILP